MWEKRSEGHSYTRIAIDSSENIYILGYDQIASQAVVVKLNTNGQEIWSQLLTIDEYTSPGGITVDADDNILITGSSGPDKKLSGLAETIKIDCYVTKLNGDGALLWVERFGGEVQDRSENIFVDASGSIFITGLTFSSTLGKDDDEPRFKLSSDAFLASFSADGQKNG